MSKELTIQKQVEPILKQADILVIASPKAMEKASELLTQINQKIDAIEEEREKVTKPLNEALKAENGRWKPMRTQLEERRDILRKGMTAYQTEQTRLAEEEAAKIAARVGDGKGKLKAETAVKQMEAIDTPAASVTTASGLVKFKKVEKFEVMDMVLLAKEKPDCVTANDMRIRELLKEGIRLPGVRYYTENVPINFR